MEIAPLRADKAARSGADKLGGHHPSEVSSASQRQGSWPLLGSAGRRPGLEFRKHIVLRPDAQVSGDERKPPNPFGYGALSEGSSFVCLFVHAKDMRRGPTTCRTEMITTGKNLCLSRLLFRWVDMDRKQT